MINIQSPSFSNSSKIDLLNKLSPSYRNRIPSVNDIYSSQRNKVHSSKKIDSPTKMSERRIQRSHSKNQAKKNETPQPIADEMSYLKE